MKVSKPVSTLAAQRSGRGVVRGEGGGGGDGGLHREAAAAGRREFYFDFGADAGWCILMTASRAGVVRGTQLGPAMPSQAQPSPARPCPVTSSHGGIRSGH